MRFNVVKLMVVICALLGGVSAFGKSVYTISTHSSSTVKVFEINGDGLVPQYSNSIPNNGSGAIDLALNETDGILFSSYDGANVIEVVNAKTMEPLHTETIGGGTENEIAGLAYCHTYNWLLCSERYDTDLRIFTYDAFEQNFSHSTTVTVPGAEPGLLGICIDEEDMRVYITQSDTVVRCYTLGRDAYGNPTLTFVKNISIQWNNQDKIAVGAAIYNDGQGTQYLYTVGYNHEDPAEHPYLIRTDVNDPNNTNGRLGTDMGSSVYAVGVDVDNDTGYVYLTTLGNESSIRVYNPLSWTSDPDDCQPTNTYTGTDISGPAGIVVGSQFKGGNWLWLNKEQLSPDPNDAVEPGDDVTYQITFHPGDQDEENVFVLDKLPYACDFVSADPNDGVYDAQYHTYTWELGNVAAYDPNEPGDPNAYFEITLQINTAAEPAGTIVNIAGVESDRAVSTDKVTTSVECWTWPGSDPNVIYVDSTKFFQRNYYASLDFIGMEHLNTGTSWDDAYSDLNDALARAGKGCGNEIWVAGGLYQPGTNTGDSFDIPDGVSVYGGFAGVETSLAQRDITKYKTVLSGFISEDEENHIVTRNNTVVTMGDGAVLDGFSIEKSGLYGISGSDDDFSVINCLVKDNNQTGLYCENGNIIVQWCEISNNGQWGVYHLGGSYLLTVENCRIYNNQYDGIRTSSTTPIVINSLVYQNGSGSDFYTSYYGLNLLNPSSSPTIRNNTIVQNVNAGIRRSGGSLPDVVNCIVYYNGGTQLVGIAPDDRAYNCCIADCNEVNDNINDAPGFAYMAEPGVPVVGNYHLAYDSPCVNTGDSDEYTAEFDIDGEPRVYGVLVDRGADEASACDQDLSERDIYHPLDWNADGVVNYEEFAPFSAAWLSHDPNDPVCDPNHPNHIDDPNTPGYISQTQKDSWNPVCNFNNTGDSTYAVDLADLMTFCEDDPQNWLWTACWRQNQLGAYEMMMSGSESLVESGFLSMQTVFETSSLIATDPTVETETLLQIIDFVDKVLEESPDNFTEILELKGVLKDWLKEIDNQ